MSLFAPLPTAPGGWPCVVADPPWSFRDKGSRIAPDQRQKRRGRKGYRTLSLDDLVCLDVRAVVAPDALLFMWTTSAHLLEHASTELCRSWGFEPKATIAWVKARPMGAGEAGVAPWPSLYVGMGHYVRGAHELVIVAARGRAARLVQDRGVPSVIFAPRGAHSAKPEAFRTMVERITPGPYLELFARSRRSAWMTWGDQLGEVA